MPEAQAQIQQQKHEKESDLTSGIAEKDVRSVEISSSDSDSYNFDAFISKMRHESCKPILENIKRFIKVFLDKLPSSNIDEMVEAYKSFYSVIKVKCMQAEIWRGEETSASERANALEGLESLIMNQLHDRVICFDRSEEDLDIFMERKMALHAGWIQMEHLDVPEGLATRLKDTEGSWMCTAVTEFQKMSVYRTPRDKLVCALNGLINDSEMSADDFLPLLIYTLIRANPPQIYSNINYISRFRSPDKISGETAYYFTHLMAAAEFIEKMDRQALKISEESYETFMEAAISDFNQHQSERRRNDEDGEDLEVTFNEKLDLAEAKAEEFFLKAKEAFKVTGERANQAFSSFKESKLAKKSLEKINNFIKDFQKEETPVQANIEDADDEEDFDLQLAKAISLSEEKGSEGIGAETETVTEDEAESIDEKCKADSTDNVDKDKDNE